VDRYLNSVGRTDIRWISAFLRHREVFTQAAYAQQRICCSRSLYAAIAFCIQIPTATRKDRYEACQEDVAMLLVHPSQCGRASRPITLIAIGP